jgi:hypothetical protein
VVAAALGIRDQPGIPTAEALARVLGRQQLRTNDHAKAVLTHHDTPGTPAQDPRKAQASAAQLKEQAD